MDRHDWLAEQFDASRGRLRAVAYRMLGSPGEAEDAVQEAWLRLSRSDSGSIDNLGGWLTTTVARVCLDMLRGRKARREDPLTPELFSDRATSPEQGGDPEQEALLAESVSAALLVVLDHLAPAERVAFVLHDVFHMPFDEIAPVVGRTPEATRQLASRARRRVRGASAPARSEPAARELVDAFLAAARGGDFDALVAALDPNVVLTADQATVRAGAEPEVRGAAAVAKTFAGRARAARPALVDGAPGLVWVQNGTPRVVFTFAIADGRIVEIALLSDPERLKGLDLTLT